MELQTAIEILEYHQQWILGKREDMIHEPKKLKEALDIVLSEVKKFRLGAVSGSLLSDTDYWKQRCLLAEQCLEESPCDPDITADQIKAWNAYHKFISWDGNDR